MNSPGAVVGLAGRWISEAAKAHAAGHERGVWSPGRHNITFIAPRNAPNNYKTLAMIRKVGNHFEARITGWEWQVARERGRPSGFSAIELFWTPRSAQEAVMAVLFPSYNGSP